MSTFNLWFSRHIPTSAQLAEVSLNDETIQRGVKLGSENIITVQDGMNMLLTIIEGVNIKSINYINIYGVFPAAMLAAIHYFNRTHNDGSYVGLNNITFYSAINNMRTIEGDKSTFEHVEFVPIASIEL